MAFLRRSVESNWLSMGLGSSLRVDRETHLHFDKDKDSFFLDNSIFKPIVITPKTTCQLSVLLGKMVLGRPFLGVHPRCQIS